MFILFVFFLLIYCFYNRSFVFFQWQNQELFGQGSSEVQGNATCYWGNQGQKTLTEKENQMEVQLKKYSQHKTFYYKGAGTSQK